MSVMGILGNVPTFCKTSLKYKKVWVALALCLIVTMQTLFYVQWAKQKEDFHIDEILTYQLANSTYGPWWIVSEDAWESPDQLTAQMTVQTLDGAFQFRHIMEKQASDLHPFIYSMVINTACTIAALLGIGFTPWPGLIVNFIFASATTVLLYFLLRKLIKDRVVSLIGAGLFACSIGVVDMVLFTRMYVMAQFWVVVTALLHLHWWDKKKSVFFYVQLWAVSTLATLTHYHYLFYLFFICLAFGIYLLIQKKYLQAVLYAFTEGVAGITVICIFPPIIKQLFTPSSSTQIFDKGTFPERFVKYFSIMSEGLFAGLAHWILLGFLVVGIFLVFRYKNILAAHNYASQVKLFVVVFPVLPFMMVIAATAPYYTARYLSMLYPIIVASVVAVFYWMGKILLQSRMVVLRIGMGALCVAMVVSSYSFYQITNLNQDRVPVLEQAAQHAGKQALLVGENSWQVPYDYSEIIQYSSYLWATRESLETEEIRQIMPTSSFLVYLYDGFSGDGYVPPEEMEEILSGVYGKEIVLQHQWDTRLASVYLCTP